MKFLIPLSYLTEACFMSSNINEKEFKMNLKLAQEDLMDILGPEFYEEIEDQYDPNNDTLTADNATLYEDYLKDYLAWRTYYISLGMSQSKSTPTGERQFSEESSTILEDVKFFSKEKNVLERSNKYKNKIINFLRLEQSKDSTKYPLWEDQCLDQFGWAISSITRDSHQDAVISINKALTSNE